MALVHGSVFPHTLTPSGPIVGRSPIDTVAMLLATDVTPTFSPGGTLMIKAAAPG